MEVIKKENIFIDSKGYPRFKDSKRLVHRFVAEKYIWKKNKKKFPFPFEEYQVHHIDKDKKNYRSDNLKLLTVREHEIEHNLVRAETLVIKALFVLFCMMGVLNIAGFIMRDYIISQNIRLFIGIFIITLSFLIIYLITRKKKDQKII
ncbi:hypothetical protein GF336_07355 [Candidatus Woesearchaeota archaeon]|nr:hypothetical protein [Candidatus Woesearchaeota archaeon]